MPLSEEEQRILDEMAKSFYESDPAFAREVSSRTLYRHAGRNLKWAALGFIAGLVLLVTTFAANLLLGFLGFAVMLAAAFVFQSNLRKMGRAGWQEWTGSMRTSGLGQRFGGSTTRIRDRFRRDE